MHVQPSPVTEPPDRAQSRWIAALIVAVAAGIAVARIMTVTVWYSPAKWPHLKGGQAPPHVPFLSANDRSRWSTVHALVDHGTYRIDDLYQRPGWHTIDNVQFEGHIYSSKPPFLATLVAGMYWTIQRATGWTLESHPHEIAQLILLAINALPAVIYLLLLGRMAERCAANETTRVFLLLAAAFGTLLSTFQITLNNHTPAAHAVLFALYAALRIVIDGDRRTRWFAMAGFFAGFAASCEIPAGLFVVLLAVWLGRTSPRQVLIAFLPLACIPLGFFFVTNWIVTNDWRPFYAGFGTELYNYVRNGKLSYWGRPQGIDKGGDSPPVYLFHCVLGHHGILSLSPIFLVTLAAWFRPRRDEPQGWRELRWGTILITLVTLGFYLLQTKNYNYSGVSCGLRWMMWLTPLWLLQMPPVLDAWQTRPWFRRLAVVCLAISVFSATAPSLNPWQHPWLYNLLERAGWISYS